MKASVLYAIFRFLCNADDSTLGVIFYIIGLIIGVALVAAIPTIIAKTFLKKNDEECKQIFLGSAGVLGIITVIGLLS